MEILVLIMSVLFLAIISLAVVIYIIVHKNSVSKEFTKELDKDLDDFEDLEDDELPNVVLPLNFRNQFALQEEKLENTEINLGPILQDEKEDIIEELTEEIEKIETDTEIIQDDDVIELNEAEIIGEENTLVNIDLINSNTKKEKLEEVVNVLINKKNYIFLANNNKVSKNDHIKLIIDKKIYFGTVTKANYVRDITNLKVRPKKLIIIKNKNKKINQDKVNDYELEYIPIKKNK